MTLGETLEHLNFSFYEKVWIECIKCIASQKRASLDIDQILEIDPIRQCFESENWS